MSARDEDRARYTLLIWKWKCNAKWYSISFLSISICMVSTILLLLVHGNNTPLLGILQSDDRVLSISSPIIPSPNYTMNKIWRTFFVERYRFTRIHMSEQCKFAYFLTLKTASTTTRLLINKKKCGVGSHLWTNGNQHHDCGDHDCTLIDLRNMESAELLTMIFVRNPISRFESAYNYIMNEVPITLPPAYELESYRSITSKVSADPINTNTTMKIRNETEVFRGYIRLYYDIVHGKTTKSASKAIPGMHKMHLQPLMHSSCIKIDSKCIKV